MKYDLLTLPIIGSLARWRYGRLVFQVPLLLIALLLVYDGLTGPQRAAENLATVVPWVHYRGIGVLALLLVGNLFCLGCPFTIPRTLAKRLSINGRRFPRALRNKWMAIISLMLLFFLYEYLDLWNSPALTAWVIMAYFVGSFVMETVFTESAFCKYVCPLGTFNFVYATAAPTQIAARDTGLCRMCVGKECVTGSYAHEPVIRIDQILGADGGTVEKKIEHGPQGTLGCGTRLFVPQIISNHDCVLCLDCVRACPHDNVVLIARTPGRELMRPDAWPKRWDMAFLVVSLTYVGLLNAFGMVPPVYRFMQDMADTLRLTSMGLSDGLIEFIVLTIIFIVVGVLLPAMSLASGAWISRSFTRTQAKYSQHQIAAEFAPAFVPIGLGIWIAHYGFHFLIGMFTIVPVFHNFLIDHRIRLLGSTPDWTLGGISDLAFVGLIQFVALLGGFFWSMLIVQRVSLRIFRRQAFAGLLPWALILIGIMLAGIWLFDPDMGMEMRGTISFN